MTTIAMHRRDLLRYGAVAASSATIAGTIGLIPWTARAYAETVSLSIAATAGNIRLVDGSSAYLLSFSQSGSVEFPSNTITCQEGDTLNITLKNTLSIPVVFALAATSIRYSIPAGQTLNFIFQAPAAGTYLYHDDQNGGINRVMGLAGALISMPRGIGDRPFADGPQFVRQYKWIWQTIDTAWSKKIASNLQSISSIDPNTFMPRYFTINGKSFPDTHEDLSTSLHGNYYDAALVRFLNAGGMIHSPHFHGNHVRIITENHLRRAADNRKTKDIVPLLPLETKEVIFPFEPPPDAWPPIGLGEVHQYPMHDHCEPSQTAAGGSYPYGAHVHIHFGNAPHHEPHI